MRPRPRWISRSLRGCSRSDLTKAQEELGPARKDNPQLKEALAALESAQLDLRHTTVSAPAEGVVTKTA